MQRLVQSVWVLLCGGAAAIAAQQHLLSEEEFLHRVGEDHPAMVVLSRDLGVAEGEQRQASRLLNPEIAADLEDLREGERETVVAASWRPALDGRRGLAIAAAEKGVEAEAARLEHRRLDLRLQMRRVFADWSLESARLETLLELGRRLEALAGQARARADEGEASGLEASRLELAAGVVASDVAGAEAALLRTEAALREWAPDLPREIRPAHLPLPSPPSPEEAGDRADRLWLESRAEQAELLRREARKWASFPELTLGWKWLEIEQLSLGGPVFGFSWSVPIFDRRSGEEQASRARSVALRAELAWLEIRIGAERSGALQAYRRLYEGVLAQEARRIDLEAVVEATLASYRLGESSLTDLLETLRGVGESRLEAAALRHEALAAHRALEAAFARALTGRGTP